MNIAITGASGLLGSALVTALRERGDTVLPLVRRTPATRSEVQWDPARGIVDPQALARHGRLDAVVHLAGENIAARRWSASQKERIRASRVDGTRALATSLAALDDSPRAFIAASAIGYYGDTGAAVVDETAPAASGYLPEVCRDWEAACAPLADRGARVANLRFGVILSATGGALKKMLLPFRLGVGGVVGSGTQGLSWITLRDAVGVVIHAAQDEGLSGPVNAVAPVPCSNREFTKALGRALGRPTIFPMPAFAARLAFGEMADALLLASAWVRPAALERSGYAFQDAEIEAALRAVLAD